MNVATFSVVLLLLFVGTVAGGKKDQKTADKKPKPGPWKGCRGSINSMIEVLQGAIKGMADVPEKKEMYVCDPACQPCEQIILTNLESLSLAKEDPCSRQTYEGNDDCFDQYIPLQLTKFSINCCFSNEITFLAGLVKYLGKSFQDLICKIPVCKVLPFCLGNVVGAVTGKLGLGKRDLPIVKRAKKEPVACKDQKKNFCLQVWSEKSLLDMNMTNDWENDCTNITACSFRQASIKSLALQIVGGKFSLLGPVLQLITKDLVIVGRLLGLIFQIPMNMIVPKVMKDTPEVKDHIGSMNCGD